MKKFFPLLFLVLLVVGAYWQFFLQGKIPISTDTLVGAYYPWYEHDWGYFPHVPIKNAPISDTYSQFLPWKYFVVEQLIRGEFPLWNPYVASGTPFLATYHSSSLNPFNLILFLPRHFGWGLFVFCQTLVAALGMFFLLRKFTQNVFAAIAGAIVFCLSGLMTNWIEFGTGVWAASMLPWIFYSLHSFWDSKKIRYLILLTGAFATLFLSGHAQLTVYGSVLFFLYLFIAFINNRLKFNDLVLPVIFYVFAVLVALVQLLPAYDFTQHTIRAGEAYSSQFNFGLNAYYEVIRLIAADFFGNPTTGNHWDTISYHEQSSFLGTLSLPLILPLLFKRFRKVGNVGFWAVIFVASIILAIDSPLTQFLYSQPVPLLTYSSASRIFFVTSFSAAILVGFSLSNIKEPSYRLFLRYSMALFLTALVLVTGSVYGYLQSIQGKEDLIGKDSQMIINLNVTLRNLVIPMLILVVGLGASFIRKWNILVIVIIALLYFDLARYFLKYNPFVESKLVMPTTPSIEYLQKQEGLFRIATLDEDVLPANTWMYYKLSSVSGYDPMLLLNYAHFFNRANNGSFDGGISRYFILRDFSPNFMNALNVKYFVGLSRDELARPGKGVTKTEDRKLPAKRVFEDQNTIVLENPTYVERVYVPSKLINFKDEADYVDKINQEDFDPAREALLLNSDLETKDLHPAKVSITSYSPNKITINSASEKDSFAILADTYEKGWRLYEGDKEVPIYQVNGALRGFSIPQGERSFTFKYWPVAFDLGLKLSVSALISLALISAYALKRRIW